jgi:hypothetical protein
VEQEAGILDTDFFDGRRKLVHNACLWPKVFGQVDIHKAANESPFDKFIEWPQPCETSGSA